MARAPSPPPAQRFDPPLRRAQWTTARSLAWRELLDEAERRLGVAGAAARAAWHGGFAFGGRPLDPFAPPPAQVSAGTRVVVWAFEREPEPVALPADAVLFDAAGAVAVAKPPWMPMQRTRASARHDLERALRLRLEAPDLRAVHRLDRQTSGVALFARDAASAARLARALRSPGAARRYLAWVAPAPAADCFRVAGWLGRVADPARFRFALRDPRPGSHPFHVARWSATSFRVLHREAGRALVRAEPETGRTHQIRVHLAAAGSPVLGDDLYGPAPAAEAPRRPLHGEVPRRPPHGEVPRRPLHGELPRLLLHAESLQLRLPGCVEAQRLRAPWPEDFPPPPARSR